jgi:hypothetical protein
VMEMVCNLVQANGVEVVAVMPALLPLPICLTCSGRLGGTVHDERT